MPFAACVFLIVARHPFYLPDRPAECCGRTPRAFGGRRRLPIRRNSDGSETSGASARQRKIGAAQRLDPNFIRCVGDRTDRGSRLWQINSIWLAVIAATWPVVKWASPERKGDVRRDPCAA